MRNALTNVLFGMANESNAVNLIILIVKQYLVSCKLSQEPIKPSFNGAKILIRYYVSIEKHIATVNSTYKSFVCKWHTVLDKFGMADEAPPRPGTDSLGIAE